MKFKDSIKQALSNSAQTPTFFPDWFYTNPELLSQEIKSIFRKIWLYVGNARCLAEAGTVWVTEVGDCSILIVRTAKDQLKAFHNLCPHRASLLLPQTGVQRVKRLVCPYHAWVYSLEGDLMQTPAADRFPECFRREDFPLKPILCQEWQGFIFVALAPDVPSLPQFLGAAGKTLQTHSTPSTQLLVQKQYEVACNWKNYHDNTLCDYHVRFVHPQTLNPVQGIVSKYEHYFEQYVNLLYTPTTKSWRATNSVMAKLNNRDRFGFYTYGIFPNLHLLALPNGVIAWLRIDPITVGTCQVNLEIYGIPGLSPTASELEAEFAAFMAEDIAITEMVQQGYGSGAYTPGIANELEARIVHQQGLIGQFLLTDG